MTKPAAPLWSDIEFMYREFYVPIYQYIARKVCQSGATPELAEDLCQETFCKAFEAMQSGVEVTHVSGFLFRIARNLVIDHYRKRSSQPPPYDYDDAWDSPAREPSPYDQVASAIGYEAICGAIGRLTGQQATIVALQVEGCNSAEMAASVDKTVWAAKALLHRGRVRLKELFVTVGYEP